MRGLIRYVVAMVFPFIACSKKEASDAQALPGKFDHISHTINGQTTTTQNVSLSPAIRITFSEALESSSVASAVSLKKSGATVSTNFSLENGNKTLLVQPAVVLDGLSSYALTITTALKAVSQAALRQEITVNFTTGIDSSRKFPPLTDEQLLNKVQQQTLKYFRDFAHPVSGLAREGTKHNNDIVTSGGSGFGIMALLVGAERGFIPKANVLAQVQKIVAFLKNTAQTFHGAYPHWLNGSTGAVIPFGTNNGADIVETSYLVQGLLCARQYFNSSSADEINLRNDINTIYNRVEWTWFTQNNANVLSWQYNPSYTDANDIWSINVSGWNECLVTYVLAASSATYSISKTVYDNGWARNGNMKNGKTFYNILLPLGQDYGGPLFFEHYSFLGINPKGLSDAYASYETQTTNHTLINYNHCKANPNNYYGYSDSVWGLTASNIKDSYTASSPTNDRGYIAPTAAISSMPYTPNQSMAALKFFYYVLGDKIFKDYGFTDAFTLDVIKNNGAWFDDAYLAIDQGPIVVMIENYRTGLLWNLFMSCPEIKSGLTKLGFSGF